MMLSVPSCLCVMDEFSPPPRPPRLRVNKSFLLSGPNVILSGKALRRYPSYLNSSMSALSNSPEISSKVTIPTH